MALDAEQSGRSPINETVLKVSGLTVSLGGKAVLEEVGFDLRRGAALAIVGPNGGGKTTLFRALMGLVPHKGTVQWMSGVRTGFVPQSLISTDLPISVEEFLRLKGPADFKTCVNAVGLPIEILGRHLGSLSGGELQRVLIAWAIVDRPNFLLFDEPTSGVDIGAEEPIYQNLDSLRTKLGITTLLISHNMHVVMHYSDFVLALNGRVLYFGPTRSISHTRLLEIIYGERFAMTADEPKDE